MHPVESEAAAKLREKIDKIEGDILQQKQQNEVLLRMLQNGSAIHGTSAERVASVSAASLSGPIAILVIACNRPNAIRNHLDQLLKYAL